MTDLRDARSFSLAYERHRGRAFRAANSVLCDPAAAEDVVQEVFADLWSRPRRFDELRGSLSAFVAMRARCKAIDIHRSRRSHAVAVERAAGAAAGPPAHESAADTVIRGELRAQALGALGRLPAEQRTAVLLTSATGLSVPELARVTGAPLGTAKSRVRLGLNRSRMLMESGG